MAGLSGVTDNTPDRVVRVIRPGLLTTVQDHGRWGYQALGVPVAGPMDRWSHRLANRLLGNDDGDATLEITLLGPELAFEQPATIAVAGALFRLSIVESDGTAREASMSTAVAMPAGARLRVQERRAGARAYLAVDGGFAVPTVLGSRATHLVARMGGIEGRALRSGDVLPLGRRRSVRPRASPPGMDLPVGGARLRVLPGPDDAWFDEAAIERLVTGRFVISAASNRMGFRLDGPPLAWQSSVEFISDAATMGHIQVPPSGDPILLMADRATAGGYPKIATVISADLPLAGQLAPGDWIEFVRCDRGEAIRALIRQEQRLLSWV